MRFYALLPTKRGMGMVELAYQIIILGVQVESEGQADDLPAAFAPEKLV
jgi:hypothetical protein